MWGEGTRGLLLSTLVINWRGVEAEVQGGGERLGGLKVDHLNERLAFHSAF